MKAVVTAVLAAAALGVTAHHAAADGTGCAAADPLSNTAAACATNEEPVESLDPAWSAQFVPPRQVSLRAASLCLPLDAVFYAQTDWLRLAQKLRADASSCASYYVSVPPLAADKTRLRAGEAAKIRALGPQMHAMAEINVSGWTAWVAAGNGTWYDAGVEARNRMALAGFDVQAGDIWALNELSSAVRTGSGNARQNMRDFIRGLYTGDGTAPSPGLVWITGLSIATNPVSVYKTNLELWFGDGPFWSDMSKYVRFLSQEVYANPTAWAVAGTTAQDRLTPLADYADQIAILGSRAPSPLAPTSAFLAAANAPVGNAAWPSAPYGWPAAPNTPPSTTAQAFVAAQVYAFRHTQAARPSMAFGFAWNPANTTPPLADFVNQTASVLDRLAAAIHASETPTDDPGLGACGPDLSWCTADIGGSAFNLLWHSFHTWTQPVANAASATTAEDTPLALTLSGTDPDEGETLSYSIATQPQHGTLTNDGANVTYTPAPDYNGADSFTFRVSDGVMDSAAATVTIGVTPVNDPPVVTLDPAGPVDEGSPAIPLVAHASDVDGDPVTLTWSTPDGTASFADDDGPASVPVTVTANDGNGGTAQASTTIEVRNVPPTADAGADSSATWGVATTLSGSGTDPSKADAATLTADWDFGDGTSGTGFDVHHTYADPGTYTATLTVRDKDGGLGTDTREVVVGARTSTLAYAGPAIVDAAHAVVSASVGDATDSGTGRLAGHEVRLAIGSTSCRATTDADGVASCALDGPLVLGPAEITATFAGDSLYSGSSAAGSPILYRLPAGGAFVIGDRSAKGSVTFWGESWWLANLLSGGEAPASFKGFAQPAAAGFTAHPGFEGAPASVPAWMGVLVTSHAAKDGASIAGDVTRIAVVHVSSYDPLVGGAGTVAG